MGELKPCGTVAAHRRHMEKKEAVCNACRKVWNIYMAAYRRERAMGQCRVVLAVGARRRLRALMAQGWTLVGMSAASGIPERTLTMIVSGDGERILRVTDIRCRELYERSWGQVQVPRRLWRARCDIPPPLAWDDDEIDNPNATPAEWQRSARQSRKSSELLQDVDELRSQGYTLPQIAERIGITAEAITRAQSRYVVKQQKVG